MLLACGREPTASELTAKGVENGFSFAFDFNLAGDAELPNKARMNVKMSLLGVSFDVETITVDGKEYMKDGVSDPLGNVDMSLIRDVVEVDRPEVDGRKTRHLRYQADTAKMLDELRKASGMSSQISNPQGTGELWIRIDDSQIVRQLVKVSLDVDGLAGIDIPGTTSNIGKASMELSLDMRFSHHGETVPQITAPPVGP